MKYKIIGLVGYKQSGKSTAAKYLEDKYGFVRHNFKDALVAEIKQNFPDLLEEIAEAETARKLFLVYDGEPAESYIPRLFEHKPPLMRALMQNYGTEVRRRDRDDYWTNKWYNKCLLNTKYVADDVRFLNEAETIRHTNGTLIRIIRTDIETGGDHASETEQDQIEVDHTITVEPGDLDKLYAELDRIVANGGV